MAASEPTADEGKWAGVSPEVKAIALEFGAHVVMSVPGEDACYLMMTAEGALPYNAATFYVFEKLFLKRFVTDLIITHRGMHARMAVEHYRRLVESRHQ